MITDREAQKLLATARQVGATVDWCDEHGVHEEFTVHMVGRGGAHLDKDGGERAFMVYSDLSWLKVIIA